MENNVLVDSNVYIDLLRRKKDVIATLYAWIHARDGNLSICGIVRLEVLRGVISIKQHRKISAFMDVMCNVPSDNRLWAEATELAWNLDRKGQMIPAVDVVIAASALRIGAALLTSDTHFARIDGLRVLTPPAEWFGS